jgi:Sulfatase
VECAREMKVRKSASHDNPTALEKGLKCFAALAALYLVLVLPDRISDMRSLLALRMPLELPLIVLALIAVSGKPHIFLRTLIVAVLTVVLLFKLANMAAYFGFGRPFNPLVDSMMVPVVLDTLGKARGIGAVIAALAATALVFAGVVAAFLWATDVFTHSISRYERLPAAFAGLVATAIGFTSYGTWGASLFARAQVAAMIQSLEDTSSFRAQLLKDPFAGAPAENRLARLKGNDVLLIFVESYGRSSLDNPAYAPLLRGTLKRFGAALEEKGFTARSAWVTSPTFGGESYLSHSTTVSGLWINNQQRYVQLLRSKRDTLISDFNTAGWRTVAVMPEITMPWPEAAYYRFAKIYAAPDLNYKGEPFDYMTMPDQYALSAIQTLELEKADREPVMAVIALISSHIPWAPIPKIVTWDNVGDGSIFTTARTPETANDVWRDPARVPVTYAQSIDYTLQTLQSFVTTFGRDNMLVIIMGDHQPMTFLTGEGASYEVPVHMIARDPALLALLDEGRGTPGMEPLETSPSWPMDTLRALMIRAFAAAPAEPSSPPPVSAPVVETPAANP